MTAGSYLSMALRQTNTVLELFPQTAEVRDGVLWVGGCSTVELAEEHGTPLVVYCEETIRTAARAWRSGAPGAAVVYGTKAFPNTAIMRLLGDEGVGADVSTLGEMQYAKAAGIPPSAWVVHGNNKSDEELAFAAENDAWLVVMDEPGEVERCVEAGVKRVLLRITPGVEADTHAKIMTGHLGSKFGVPLEDAAEVVDRARAAGLDLLGLHVHLGSQLKDDSAVQTALDGLAAFTSSLSWSPAVIDAGGGLAIRYAPDDPAVPAPEDYARGVAARVAERWPAAQLIFEPGRSLVGRAGLTLYRVGVVKKSGATRWVAVDGGMSDNPRPALYGARYTALVANRAADPATGTYAVCGKHCESGDVLIEQVELADPARGDLLAVPVTGAYALSMASNYNALPRPAAVLASDGQTSVIRSRDAAPTTELESG
jgi:diaminopimelate decarboxylase